METKIKEVQDYFKNKLLTYDFGVVRIDDYTIKLIVDSKYLFVIWTGNTDIPEARKIYNNELSFIDLQFTDEESIQLDKVLTPLVLKYKKEVLIAQKEQELERLKKEIQ